MDTPDVQEPTAELEESAAPVAEDSTPESDPFDSGADSFDRAYVEKLRKESASYRTKAKDYEQYAKHFEAYGDEDRQVWAEAMRRFNEDPKSGAEYLDQIAKSVLAEYQDKAETPAAEDGDVPLTMAQYRELRAAEAAAAAEAAEVARIEKEATDLGYDPASDEYTYLLTVASRLPSGSLQEAHAKIEASYQARIEKYLQQKAADAEGAPAPPAEGNAPSGERQIRTWADARAAAEARIDAAARR